MMLAEPPLCRQLGQGSVGPCWAQPGPLPASSQERKGVCCSRSSQIPCAVQRCLISGAAVQFVFSVLLHLASVWEQGPRQA